MRINLTKKDLINQIYMQLGFSKLVSENLINDFFSTVILNLKEEKKHKGGTCVSMGCANTKQAEVKQ